MFGRQFSGVRKHGKFFGLTSDPAQCVLSQHLNNNHRHCSRGQTTVECNCGLTPPGKVNNPSPAKAPTVNVICILTEIRMIHY